MGKASSRPQEIEFVVDRKSAAITRANLLEHIPHNGFLFEALRIGHIHDVQNQVRFHNLLESRSKCRYQLMRKLFE